MRYVVILMMLALSACSLGVQAPTETDAGTKAPVVDSLPGVAHLQGNLDDAEGINAYASELKIAHDNQHYFMAHTYVPHGDGEAMTIVNVSGGSFADLNPGQTYVFDYFRGSPDVDMHLEVSGCLFGANRSEGFYFDSTAHEVEVFTELVDNNVERVNYIARWLDLQGTITDELQGFINIEVQ